LTVNTPDNAGHTQEPDQYGEINVDHERGVEQVHPGEDILDIGSEPSASDNQPIVRLRIRFPGISSASLLVISLPL
jgi:hypothetical protein